MTKQTLFERKTKMISAMDARELTEEFKMAKASDTEDETKLVNWVNQVSRQVVSTAKKGENRMVLTYPKNWKRKQIILARSFLLRCGYTLTSDEKKTLLCW